MKTNYFFMIASGGILAGMISVFVYNKHIKPRDPLSVSYNPYTAGVYASGIIESYQKIGSNINVFPSTPGTIEAVYVRDGQKIKKGDPLFKVDSSQEEALVNESLALAKAAQVNLVDAEDQYSKIFKAYTLNPKSVSKNSLDTAKNAVIAASENLKAAQAQAAYAQANLEQCLVDSPIDGVVLRVAAAVGDYASGDVGTYDPYTQGYLPPVTLGEETSYLQVRVYVDELLTPQLPQTDALEAMLFVRGMKNKSIPLQFEYLQPSTIPNIQLSDNRKERVDVRVLPIVFKFERPQDITLYPGQLVDVYIKVKA